jgi:hypothetical protein
MRTAVVESGVKGKLSTAYVIFDITAIYDGTGLALSR